MSMMKREFERLREEAEEKLHRQRCNIRWLKAYLACLEEKRKVVPFPLRYYALRSEPQTGREFSGKSLLFPVDFPLAESVAADIKGYI